MDGEKQQSISFNEFELDTAHRQLLREGESVQLYAKTFDLLSFLVKNSGRVLTKDEILDAVWEGEFVEEANLSVQISALRKALGETVNTPRFLVTVPGKGYKFVADVKQKIAGLTLERHSFKRLVIDEEIVETPGLPTAVLRPPNSKNSVLLYFSSVLLVFLLIGGGYWIYRLSSAGSEVEPKRNLISRNYATNGIPQRVSISPDGKTLAFAVYQKGFISVWLGDLATGNNIQLIQPSNRIINRISFDPSGNYVYFISQDDNHPMWTLMRVSTFGGAVEDLITDVDSSVTFSPDGKQLAFIRRGETDALVIADNQVNGEERILQKFDSSRNRIGSKLSWSPDGKHFAAFLSDEGGGYKLTLININNGERQTLGERSWNIGANVVWLTDGSGMLIVNAEDRGHLGNSQVWSVDYPQGDIKQLTDDLTNYADSSLAVSNDNKISLLTYRVDPEIWISPTVEDVSDDKKIIAGVKTRAIGMYGLAIAPDGKVLFTARTDNSQNIWEMNQDGSQQRQLTSTEPNSRDSQISVTADNRFLIFQSNRSGKSEIWRANRDGSDQTQMTDGGGNIQPTISPDGKRIIYTLDGNDMATLWRIPVEGGQPQQVTDEQTSWASVSPDGKYIAASYRRETAYENLPRIAVYPSKGGKPAKITTLPRKSVLYNRFRWSPDGKSLILKAQWDGLWRFDLNEEKPEEINLREDFRIGHFAISPDGDQFVYAGGMQIQEIIILENSR